MRLYDHNKQAAILAIIMFLSFLGELIMQDTV